MKQYSTQFIISSILLCLILSSLWINPVSAQDSAKVKKWHFLTDVYLMFPYMDGETGIGNLITVPVDANPGDIFDKLKMAAMLYFEARNDKWAITSDMVYMKLNQEVTAGTLLNSGNVTAKQFIWETSGLYRIFTFLEVGAGGRLNYISTDIGVRRNVFPAGTEEVAASASKTWFDPVIITRITGDIKDKWLFQFRGDIGGFGVGSDLTWQLQGYAGYRFSKVFQLMAGYRILGTDYDKGSDAERFIFNVNEFGPVIRFGFNF